MKTTASSHVMMKPLLESSVPSLTCKDANASMDKRPSDIGDGCKLLTNDDKATVVDNKENAQKCVNVDIHDSQSKHKNVTPFKGTAIVATKMLLLEGTSNFSTPKYTNRVSLEPTRAKSLSLTPAKASPSLPTITEEDDAPSSNKAATSDTTVDTSSVKPSPKLSDSSPSSSDDFEAFLAKAFPDSTDDSFDKELVGIFDNWDCYDTMPNKEEEESIPSSSAAEDSSSSAEESPETGVALFFLGCV